MVSLNIKVPSKFRLLPSYRIRRQVPENWQEVTKQQLINYCKAMRLASKAVEVRMLAARYMLKLPWWLFYLINKYQLAEITYELHWLSEEPLTLNKLPRIARLHGPADQFSNLTFAEFAVASAYYQAYMRNNNVEMLHYLIAVLYRPLNRQSQPDDLDRREPFAQHTLNKRIKKIAKLHSDTQQAVLLYFAGCQAELALRYPLLFASPETDERHSADYTPAQSTGSSDWLDFMRHLPSDKFGSLEQIEKSFIHPVMEVANRMMADAKKEKARLKRSAKTSNL